MHAASRRSARSAGEDLLAGLVLMLREYGYIIWGDDPIEIENTDDLLEIFQGFHSLKYLNVHVKQLTALTSNM